MISLETAKALKEAGLEWEPKVGDWFYWNEEPNLVTSCDDIYIWSNVAAWRLECDYLIFAPRLDQLIKEGVKRGYWIAIVPYPTKTKVIWEALLYTWWNGDFCELTEKEFMEGDKSNVPLFVHDFPEEAAAQALLWILQNKREGGINMKTTILCPKCGNLAHYSYHFQKYMCSSKDCCWMGAYDSKFPRKGNEVRKMTERDWQKDMEICKKATPGPWWVDVGKILNPCSIALGHSDEFNTEVYICLGTSAVADAIDDAEFIAESREALPYWLQRVRELEEKIEQLKVQLAER